jgi:molecular chaperone GrpE
MRFYLVTFMVSPDIPISSNPPCVSAGPATANELSGGCKQSASSRKNHELKRRHPMTTASKTPLPLQPEANDIAGPAGTESEALLNDLAAQRDLHLRLAADFENFKRRTRQEVETRTAAQKELFMVELLPVVDNLERALTSGVSSDSAQLRQGVEMTLKQLHQLLRQHGVESDEVVGKTFDPHRHEALSQGHDPAQPDHAILAVFQRGYRRGDKVVRPAKVAINDLTASQPGREGR